MLKLWHPIWIASATFGWRMRDRRWVVHFCCEKNHRKFLGGTHSILMVFASTRHDCTEHYSTSSYRYSVNVHRNTRPHLLRCKTTLHNTNTYCRVLLNKQTNNTACWQTCSSEANWWAESVTDAVHLACLLVAVLAECWSRELSFRKRPFSKPHWYECSDTGQDKVCSGTPRWRAVLKRAYWASHKQHKPLYTSTWGGTKEVP